MKTHLNQWAIFLKWAFLVSTSQLAFTKQMSIKKFLEDQNEKVVDSWIEKDYQNDTSQIKWLKTRISQ